MSEAAMVRAKPSSLKANRSSSEPPPRATMMTSAEPRRLNQRTPLLTSCAKAASPCTCAG